MLVVVISCRTTIAVTRYVPNQYPTIQAAIDTCDSGDTVMVADGRYTGLGNRDIDFRGKAITVQSQNGPESCIIDCQGTVAEPHRGFIFESSESADAVLEGFTIANGYVISEGGGGILCRYRVSPTIKDCVVTANVAKIENWWDMGGGGIGCYNSSPTISGCIIRENRVLGGWSIGGGIYCEYGTPTITNCIICLNSSNDGAGIFWEGDYDSDDPIVYTSLVISNCVIRENVGGTAIYCIWGDYVTIANCTINDNSSLYGSTALYCASEILDLYNTIYWNYDLVPFEIELDNIWPVPTQAWIEYSDILDGEAGVQVQPGATLYWDSSNINLDPLFEQDGYHLRAGSPCIDAGGNSPGGTDIDGEPRVIGRRIDIGADEYFYEYTATLRGIITDGITHQRLVGAKVVVQDKETWTDINGNYKITGLSFGENEFSVSKAGYQPNHITLVLVSNGPYFWWSDSLYPEPGPSGAPPSEEYHLGNQADTTGSSNDPVNTATGNFFHNETDISIATRGIPLVFSRHYNSKDNRSGPLGRGWRHSYQIVLSEDPTTGNVSICWGDGRTDFWSATSEGISLVTDLGYLVPRAINIRGQVAGQENDRAVLWDDGGTTVIASLPSDATSINDSGCVAGHEYDSTEGNFRAFLWEPDAGLKYLFSHQESHSYAYEVNNSQKVVGWYRHVPFMEPSRDVAFLWDDYEVTWLFDPSNRDSSYARSISDSSDVVGNYFHYWLGFTTAFYRHPVEGTILLTAIGDWVEAKAVNSLSEVVGRADYRAFKWHDENGNHQADSNEVLDLGTFGGSGSDGLDISNEGKIVGWAENSSGQRHAFLYDNGAMHNLNDLISDPAWILEEATAINEAGYIIGSGIYNGEDGHGFLIKQVGYEAETPGLHDDLTKDGAGWKLTKKNLDEYLFDAGGRLANISDKNGNTISLWYNQTTDPNLVTSVSDSSGRTIAFAYNVDGTLARITDFASDPRSVKFSCTDGYLTAVTDVNENTIQYGYDPNGYIETITDQRGITIVTNTYDAQGRVIEQLDGNENRTLFAYDRPDVNQTTITDPNGKSSIHTHFTGYKLLYSIENQLTQSIFYHYDENGNRNVVTDRNGHPTEFIYDGRGNVLRTIAPDGGITIIDYNNPNFPDLPTKKMDASNNVTRWQYDNRGNVISQIDPNGGERIWTYNSFGQKLSETDENGNQTTYIYDTNGLLTEIVDAEGNHIWYGYDQLWRLTHITDGRGDFAGDPAHTTVTEYDKADRVISVTGPITTESYGYDEVGNRTRVTNGRGYPTNYYYDKNTNLIRIERPASGAQTQVVQYTYDELDRKTAATDPNGNVTTYEYDSASRLIREINDENDVTTYTYDPHGNILSITDGNGVTISYGYDPMNRKVHQYDELGNHWYRQYDKLGHLIKHTDATQSKTEYSYDNHGRLVAVTDDANNPTEYIYDRVGNLKEIQDAARKVIEKRFYDKANRLINKEDGLGNAYKYTFDGAGNVISEKNPNGHKKTFIYDNENRLIEIHYPDSSQVTYTYDKNGNLIGMTDSTGTTTYTYDELDRLTSSTDSFGKKVQYGYDLVGNRTSIGYPADSTNPARTVTYTYDGANRLDEVTDWDGRTWVYTVDGAGRVTDVNYPNGIKEQRSHDKAGRLSSLVYRGSGDANLITYSYTRDGQGNPIEISETGTLEPVLDLPLKEDYAYDNDNRLTETTKPATYGYDNNGNMTSRVSAGVTTIFAYDFDNRLISQTTGSSTVQHIYDGRGNRIARNDNGSVMRYVLDRGRGMSHVLCETDASGQIIAYYIHGPQILARVDADSSERYYHTDNIGSVVALTDESETVTDRYAYTPFGVPAGHEGSSPNPFNYVGGLGVMAEADGLYFMRARFYEPLLGRFMSKEPLEGNMFYQGKSDSYQYAGQRPLVTVDPTGLYKVWGIIDVGDVPEFTVADLYNMGMTQDDATGLFLSGLSQEEQEWLGLESREQLSDPVQLERFVSKHEQYEQHWEEEGKLFELFVRAEENIALILFKLILSQMQEPGHPENYVRTMEDREELFEFLMPVNEANRQRLTIIKNRTTLLKYIYEIELARNTDTKNVPYNGGDVVKSLSTGVK